ncbi:hypothetical protein E4U59_002944 [Claviceps monticola]|nr:hypothetical protein E4U59_002944 [Claviceps monticola]
MLWRKPPWHQTVHDAAFIINPFPIDALDIHVAGFLLNADVRKPKHEVNIANHIGSLRILGDVTKYSPFLTYKLRHHSGARSPIRNESPQNKVGAPAQEPKDGATPPSTAIFTPTSELSSTPLSSILDTIDLYEELLDTIAEWSGNSVAELQKATSTNFVALGLGSRKCLFHQVHAFFALSWTPLAFTAQASDFKPWIMFEPVRERYGLAAAFFSDNPTAATTQEALDGSPEPNIVEKSLSSEIVSSTSLPLATACTAQPEMRGLSRQNKIKKAISWAVLIQENSRFCEAPFLMITDGSAITAHYLTAVGYTLESQSAMIPQTFDLSIQKMASIFNCAIRKIHDAGRTPLVAGRQAPSMPAR